MTNNLKIPSAINKLVELGIWPNTSEKATSQNIKNIIDKDTLKKFAPNEREIYFYPPPFKTVSEELNTNSTYWNDYGALDEIDPKLSVVIGDFGIGSDTCLILDYRENLTNPKVLRLVWSDKNYWEEVAKTFEEFINILGLKY